MSKKRTFLPVDSVSSNNTGFALPRPQADSATQYFKIAQKRKQHQNKTKKLTIVCGTYVKL